MSVRGLTQTHGQRLAPGAVGLTHSGLVPLNGHVGVAAEDDGRAQSRPLLDIVQPPVGQIPRVSTVDLCNTPHLTLTSHGPLNTNHSGEGKRTLLDSLSHHSHVGQMFRVFIVKLCMCPHHTLHSKYLFHQPLTPLTIHHARESVGEDG